MAVVLFSALETGYVGITSNHTACPNICQFLSGRVLSKPVSSPDSYEARLSSLPLPSLQRRLITKLNAHHHQAVRPTSPLQRSPQFQLWLDAPDAPGQWRRGAGGPQNETKPPERWRGPSPGSRSAPRRSQDHARCIRPAEIARQRGNVIQLPARRHWRGARRAGLSGRAPTGAGPKPSVLRAGGAAHAGRPIGTRGEDSQPAPGALLRAPAPAHGGPPPAAKAVSVPEQPGDQITTAGAPPRHSHWRTMDGVIHGSAKPPEADSTAS
jgi:hypothetical protein